MNLKKTFFIQKTPDFVNINIYSDTVIEGMEKIETDLATMNMFAPLKLNLGQLKSKLLGENRKQGSGKLIKIIEEHDTNLSSELKLMETLDASESIDFVHDFIDRDYVDSDKKVWNLRTGPIVDDDDENRAKSSTNNSVLIKDKTGNSASKETNSKSLIPNFITSISKSTHESLKSEHKLKQEILENNQEILDIYSEMKLNDGNDFLLSKYADYVEDVHRVLAGNEKIEKLPQTVYEEAIYMLVHSVSNGM